MKTIAAIFIFALIAGSVDQKSAPPGKAMGVPTAPITLEVFSDFQCPSCKALYEETLRPLMRDYVASGKVYLIHRDFPLPMHAHSREAAAYADASLRFKKYEEVSAVLFGQQIAWAANGRIEDTLASVLSPAELVKVRLLAKDPKVLAEIDQDIALGQKANVHQTPTMIVTYKGRTYPITGSVNYSILSRFLDDLLAK